MKFPLVCECLFRSPSSVLPCQPPPPPSESPTAQERQPNCTGTFKQLPLSPQPLNPRLVKTFFQPLGTFSLPLLLLPCLSSLFPLPCPPFCTTSCHRHSRELSPFWRNHQFLQINFLPPKMKFKTLHGGGRKIRGRGSGCVPEGRQGQETH